MDSVLDQVEEWLKEFLISAIMSNLSGLFDSVNSQVGDIAAQVGTSPADFSPGIFSMIRNVSESVIIPIAGIILTFIACYELIQMIIDHNNLANFETWIFFKWIFKTFVAVMLITNTFNIVNDVQLKAIAAGRPLTEGYKWFTDNHPNLTNPYSRKSMRIGDILPTILDESPINRQALVNEKVELGGESRATVKKIDGKNITFALEMGLYAKMKMGDSGLENINKKNCKELLPEGTSVILKNEGMDPETQKPIWVFLRKE